MPKWLKLVDTLSQKVGSKYLRIWVLERQAQILFYKKNDLPETLTLLNQMESLFTSKNDERGIVKTIGMRAVVLERLGKVDEAVKLYEEVQQRSLKSGDVVTYATSLANQALLLAEHGQYEPAKSKIDEAYLFIANKNIALTHHIQKIQSLVHAVNTLNSSSSKEMHLAAIRTLAECGTSTSTFEESIFHIAQAAMEQSLPVEVRVAAIETLGTLKASTVIPKLKTILSDENASLRRAAEKALRNIDTSSASDTPTRYGHG